MQKNPLPPFGSKEFFRSLNKKKGFKITVTLAALLLILSPKILPAVGNVLSEPNEKIAPPPRLDVTVLKPESFDEIIEATGSLLAKSQVELSPEVSGKITELHIQEGTPVASGDLLVRINDRDLQAELSGARSELQLLMRTEDRKRQLLEKGGATQEEHDVIQAQINTKKAEIERIQADIQRTEIRAPFDGILGLRHVDQGAYVTPSTTIASIQNLSSMKIEFSIPERYAPHVEPGKKIRYRVQGIDSLFSGEVYAVEPQIDVRSRTFKVRAVSPNELGLLKPGAYAEINLVLDSHQNTITVPNIALIPEGSQFKVYRYSRGKAIPTMVEIGDRDQEKTQITAGLKVSDTILLNGFMQIEDSSTVAVRKIISNE